MNIICFLISKWTINWISIICPSNNRWVRTIQRLKVGCKIFRISIHSINQRILFNIFVKTGINFWCSCRRNLTKPKGIIYCQISNSGIKDCTRSSRIYKDWSRRCTISYTSIDNNNIINFSIQKYRSKNCTCSSRRIFNSKFGDWIIFRSLIQYLNIDNSSIRNNWSKLRIFSFADWNSWFCV